MKNLVITVKMDSDIKLVKKNEKGEIYQAEGFKILYRHKDAVAGDNSENVKKIIYFITGSAEITLEDKTWVIHAPEKIRFPAKTYHKVKALTDIIMIVFEK